MSWERLMFSVLEGVGEVVVRRGCQEACGWLGEQLDEVFDTTLGGEVGREVGERLGEQSPALLSALLSELWGVEKQRR